MGGALQSRNVKGGGVGLAASLVVVRYDVLAHVVLLQRRQRVSLLTTQRQRQGADGCGAAGLLRSRREKEKLEKE